MTLRHDLIEKIKKEKLTYNDFISARNRYVDVINFLVSEKDPADLVKEKNIVLLHDVIYFIRNGLPNHEMSLHDPVLFIRLRNRITELILRGWF